MVIIILPVLKNFTISKGVGFDYRFQWNQGVPGSAVPTDLALYSGIISITNYNGSVVYSTLTTAAASGTSGIFYGGSLQDPTNGIIDIIIVGSDTYEFSFQTARYTFTMTLIANPVLPIMLMYGTFNNLGLLT